MSLCFWSYYLLRLPWLLGIELNTCRIGWNYLTLNISHWIFWNQFPAVLVGTNSLLFGFLAVLVWTNFLPYWLEPMSRRFGWNFFFAKIFPSVLVEINFPPYWLCKIFPAVLVGTYFLPYWLEQTPCCSAFPAVLVGTNFPSYWLEPMSCHIGWNYFPQICSAVLVKTNFCRIGRNQFLVVLLLPLYLLEPVFCRIDWNQLPAVFVGTNFMPPYLLEPFFFKTIHACCHQPVSGWCII